LISLIASETQVPEAGMIATDEREWARRVTA